MSCNLLYVHSSSNARPNRVSHSQSNGSTHVFPDECPDLCSHCFTHGYPDSHADGCSHGDSHCFTELCSDGNSYHTTHGCADICTHGVTLGKPNRSTHGQSDSGAISHTDGVSIVCANCITDGSTWSDSPPPPSFLYIWVCVC